MSNWTKFVTDFYNKKHAANAKYKFKHALKDASEVYNSSDKLVDNKPLGKSVKANRKSTKKVPNAKRGTRKARK
jgi:hypothetical protein